MLNKQNLAFADVSWLILEYESLHNAFNGAIDQNQGITDSPSPRVSVSLSEPTGLPTVLDRAGINYVSVHEQRLLAIYHTGIFNVTTEPESVTNARMFEIECWEAPLPSRSDERSPQELLEDFAAVFDAGDES